MHMQISQGSVACKYQHAAALHKYTKLLSCAQQMRYLSLVSHGPAASITLIFILERIL